MQYKLKICTLMNNSIMLNIRRSFDGTEEENGQMLNHCYFEEESYVEEMLKGKFMVNQWHLRMWTKAGFI